MWLQIKDVQQGSNVTPRSLALSISTAKYRGQQRGTLSAHNLMDKRGSLSWDWIKAAQKHSAKALRSDGNRGQSTEYPLIHSFLFWGGGRIYFWVLEGEGKGKQTGVGRGKRTERDRSCLSRRWADREIAGWVISFFNHWLILLIWYYVLDK